MLRVCAFVWPLITSTTAAVISGSRSRAHSRINDCRDTTSVPDHPFHPSCCTAPAHPASPLFLCSCTLLPLSFPWSSMAGCDEWDVITLVCRWPDFCCPSTSLCLFGLKIHTVHNRNSFFFFLLATMKGGRSCNCMCIYSLLAEYLMNERMAFNETLRK